MIKLKNTKGVVTLLEIILVIAILAISIGLFALYGQTSQVRADINTQVTQFASYLREARSGALAGLNNEDHAVHLESDSYTIFEGDTYNESDPNNFEVQLPPTVTIENISLNGGGGNIIFQKPNGETENYGSVDFVSSQIGKTVSVEITKFGTVKY